MAREHDLGVDLAGDDPAREEDEIRPQLARHQPLRSVELERQGELGPLLARRDHLERKPLEIAPPPDP